MGLSSGVWNIPWLRRSDGVGNTLGIGIDIATLGGSLIRSCMALRLRGRE